MDDTQSSPDQGDDRTQKTAEALRALREQADRTLDEHRKHVSEIEDRLTTQLEVLADDLARERLADEQAHAEASEHATALQEVREALATKEAEVDELLEQLATQSEAFEAQIAERDEELEQLLELQEEESQQHDAVVSELSAARAESEQLRDAECAECQRIGAELAELKQQLVQLNEQLGSLQADHESTLVELENAQQTAASAQQQQEETATRLSEAEQSVEAADQRTAEADARVAEAQQRVDELSKLEGIDEQLEQTRRKFELALADVHKLKRENAELREELVSRPEADDQESPELVSLRSERDALAERLAELENAPAPAPDLDSQQELADLQRRFELAVDDVRQLKAENAELRQQLDSSAGSAAAPSADDAQDWQAQKARLMAALDAEDQGMIDEPRREERATIEGTISITDRVVAEKDALLAERDAEIAALKNQVEERPSGQDLEQLREEIAAELLGDDQAVQAEVARLKAKQEELDTKLREAELDISVQRATLARDQAALEEKIALLPTLEHVEDDGGDSEKPKRRWLSALGLKDESES